MAAPAENSEAVVPSEGLAAPVRGEALGLLQPTALVRSGPVLAAVAKEPPVPVAMLPMLLGPVPAPRVMAGTAAPALKASSSWEYQPAARTPIPARPSLAESVPLRVGSVLVGPARAGLTRVAWARVQAQALMSPMGG